MISVEIILEQLIEYKYYYIFWWTVNAAKQLIEAGLVRFDLETRRLLPL